MNKIIKIKSEYIKKIKLFLENKQARLFILSIMIYLTLDLIFWLFYNVNHPGCNQAICEIRNVTFWMKGHYFLNFGMYISVFIISSLIPIGDFLAILIGKIISFTSFFLIILFLNYLRGKIWK